MSVTLKKKLGEVEYVFYDSSNLLMSECDLSTPKHIKKVLMEGVEVVVPHHELKIVFKNGAQYVYHDVEYNDYITLVEQLYRDDPKSSGKTFHKFIKRYECERIADDMLKYVQEKSAE